MTDDWDYNIRGVVMPDREPLGLESAHVQLARAYSWGDSLGSVPKPGEVAWEVFFCRYVFSRNLENPC
jgi:hypothetical protein